MQYCAKGTSQFKKLKLKFSLKLMNLKQTCSQTKYILVILNSMDGNNVDVKFDFHQLYIINEK